MLLSSAGQVVVMLLVFGVAFQGMVDEVDGIPMRVYVFPGIACMNVTMTALSSSVSLAWDRTYGFARELLVAPIPRWVLPVAKTCSSAVVALTHMAVLLPLALVLGVRLTPASLIGTVAAAVMLCASFGALGVLLSVAAGRPETVAALMGIAMTPLFMLSGAVFRADTLPLWMRMLIGANPMTYAVDLLRAGLLGAGAPAAAPWPVAVVVLAVIGALSLAGATRLSTRRTVR